MTATTAPVKSFDSLREGAAVVRVTNKKSRDALTPAMIMRRFVIGPSPLPTHPCECAKGQHGRDSLPSCPGTPRVSSSSS